MTPEDLFRQFRTQELATVLRQLGVDCPRTKEARVEALLDYCDGPDGVAMSPWVLRQFRWYDVQRVCAKIGLDTDNISPSDRIDLLAEQLGLVVRDGRYVSRELVHENPLAQRWNQYSSLQKTAAAGAFGALIGLLLNIVWNVTDMAGDGPMFYGPIVGAAVGFVYLGWLQREYLGFDSMGAIGGALGGAVIGFVIGMGAIFVWGLVTLQFESLPGAVIGALVAIVFQRLGGRR